MGLTLGGTVREGTGERAILTIGLHVDCPRPTSMTQRQGATIPYAAARRQITAMRRRQVGPDATAATLVRCEGVWGGKRERTISCEIQFLPSAQETGRRVFRRHMIDLAERAAELFGQYEVQLRMGGRLYRSNAPGEKAPKALLPGAKVVR